MHKVPLQARSTLAEPGVGRCWPWACGRRGARRRRTGRCRAGGQAGGGAAGDGQFLQGRGLGLGKGDGVSGQGRRGEGPVDQQQHVDGTGVGIGLAPAVLLRASGPDRRRVWHSPPRPRSPGPAPSPRRTPRSPGRRSSCGGDPQERHGSGVEPEDRRRRRGGTRLPRAASGAGSAWWPRTSQLWWLTR